MRLSTERPLFLQIADHRFPLPRELVRRLRQPLLRYGDGFFLDEIPEWAQGAPAPELAHKIIRRLNSILGLPYRLDIWEQEAVSDADGEMRVRLFVFRKRGRKPAAQYEDARLIGHCEGVADRRRGSRYQWESFRVGETRTYAQTSQQAVHSSFKAWCQTRGIMTRRIATSRLSDGRIEVWRVR